MKLKVLRKGWTVRRAGNPRTDVGRARKALVYEVVEVHGNWREHTAALLKRPGEAFWVNAAERRERVE